MNYKTYINHSKLFSLSKLVNKESGSYKAQLLFFPYCFIPKDIGKSERCVSWFLFLNYLLHPENIFSTSELPDDSYDFTS